MKLFYFFFPLLLLWLFAEWRLASLPNHIKNKKALFDVRTNEIETLIVGTSHGHYGISPRFLASPTFNLAAPSQSLEISTQLLEKAIPLLPNLHSIVVQISYFSLDYCLCEDKEYWRNYLYTRHWKVRGDNSLWDFLDLRLFSNLFLLWPESKEFLFHRSQTGLVEEMDPWGWAQAHNPAGPGSINSETATRRIAEFHHAMDGSHWSRNSKVLQRLRAMAPNLHLLFVQLPTTKFLRDKMDVSRLSKTKEVIKASANRNLIDYLEDPRFTVDDFEDTDHLNAAGAEKFTRILQSEVLTLLPIN